MHYGSARNQVAELWRPAATSEPLPVIVLFHGGFWRAKYTKRLMHRIAADVVRRGWAAWNVEYRRVGLAGGGGGWPGTFIDAAAAIDHLQFVEGLDLARVAVCGHSAGGQLALWCAGRHRLPPGTPGEATSGSRSGGPLPLRAAVSLAGVNDLVAAAELGLGNGAVVDLMGGTPEACPDRYAVASPASLVPIGVEQIVLHGVEDRIVPISMSERYASHASALGDPVEFKALRGMGHLKMIDPGAPAWQHAALCLERAFG